MESRSYFSNKAQLDVISVESEPKLWICERTEPALPLELGKSRDALEERVECFIQSQYNVLQDLAVDRLEILVFCSM